MVMVIVQNRIPVTVEEVNGEIRYYLPGFYKSDGFVYLVEREDGIYCYQRYDINELLYEDDFMDALTSINYYWLTVTRERNPGTYIAPNSHWLPFLLEHGYVQEETTTRYV